MKKVSKDEFVKWCYELVVKIEQIFSSKGVNEPMFYRKLNGFEQYLYKNKEGSVIFVWGDRYGEQGKCKINHLQYYVLANILYKLGNDDDKKFASKCVRISTDDKIDPVNNS